MLSVWQLTKHRTTAYASCEDIQEHLLKEFKKSLKLETIQRHINKIQKTKSPKIPEYKTFDVKNVPPQNKGRGHSTYRPSKDTVYILATAWILTYLSRHGNNFKVLQDDLDRTIIEAKKYGLTKKNVRDRWKEILRVGYVQEIEDQRDLLGDFSFDNPLFERQEEYINELAKYFIKENADKSSIGQSK